MEFKGTKGDWKITRSSKFETNISCGDVRIAEAKHYDGSKFNDPTEKEGLANAKLIEAAPELLKESMKLIQQIKMSDYVEINGHNIKNNKALLDLEEAINKALK
jgi:hypothetical protein